jgi:hypothetical protein
MKLLAAAAITAIGPLVMPQSERPEYRPHCPISSPPPPCPPSYAPVFTFRVTIEPNVVNATYEASWIAPPEYGWLSDNAIPVNQELIYQGTPVTWTYARTPEAQQQFGYFSLWREDGTVPGTGRRPRP